MALLADCSAALEAEKAKLTEITAEKTAKMEALAAKVAALEHQLDEVTLRSTVGPEPRAKPARTSLFKLFFESYNEFDAKFDAVPATSSIICFGVSGAGKSAFLARLLSRLDPSGFKAALPKDSIVSIEGVNVGGTIGSTTLVPVMYNVGGELQIFDVPGFKDTDEERQVVINILHKCLLTRVQVRPRVLLNVAPIGWCNG